MLLGRKGLPVLADANHGGDRRCRLRRLTCTDSIVEAHLDNRQSEVLVPVHLAVV